MKALSQLSAASSAVLSAMISTMFCGFVLVTLSACGIGESQDDSVQAKLQHDNEKLAAVYGSVAGTYTGTLQTGGTDRALPAQLQLYVVTVQDGVDPNNAPKSRLEMRAQFKLLGVGELDDTNLVGDYKDFDGRLSLEQPTSPSSGSGGSGASSVGTVNDCQVGPRDPKLSINGRLLNGELKDAVVSGSNGSVGTLNLKRTSNENKQPLHDQADRLRAAYAKVVGTYEGPLTMDVEDSITHVTAKKNADTQIIVRVVEQPTVQGNTCPALVGQFKFTKIVGKIDDSQFSVSFRESTNEIFFTPSRQSADSASSGGSGGAGGAGGASSGGASGAASGATPGAGLARVCPTGPKDPQLALDGKVENRKLAGVLKGTAGIIGDINLTWKSGSTVGVDDQRQRLLAAYTTVAGTYGGRFDDTNASGPNYDFPVRFTLNLTDNVLGGFVRCPALKAQYLRPDLYDGIGTLLLAADYFPFENSITLRSITPEGVGPGAGVPGHAQLSVPGAVFQNGGFSGEMDWWDRVGTVTVKKCRSSRVNKDGTCG